MIVVIIAGGSGTRLWPLSTPDYPKHLLKVNGDEMSLMQRTYERAKSLTNKIYVATEAGHIHHVRDQLSDLPEEAFIVEPARRGTSNCILASLVHIAAHNDPDEPIVFLAADHYIRDLRGFEHSFKVASETSQSHDSLVLVGIEPDYPATGFGYIQKGDLIDEEKFVFSVHSFKEKPDHQTAISYLKSGNYLWNSGYFVGSVNTFKHAMENYAPEVYAQYQELANAKPETYTETYLAFESISIDYALIEKVEDLLVVPASFDWMDLGSFSDIHKAAASDTAGNYLDGLVETEEVQNSFIKNHEDKPVAVIGLDNIVVVNTPNGILIARKDMAQKVGDVSKRFKK
ncbi:MAG: mannose-phosphate guanylyltransferase [Candidatus Saccharibacteria bacterium]|nr:mannose-phosphate guanylyltransferase [Candidatus Saccharibacteria bacterium]